MNSYDGNQKSKFTLTATATCIILYECFFNTQCHVYACIIQAYFPCTCMTYQLTVYSDIVAALSLPSSIVWDDCEGILIARTGVVWSEDTECLSDIDTVRIWHRHCSLICHIVDEDRVPDIRINTSHIQREWSTP